MQQIDGYHGIGVQGWGQETVLRATLEAMHCVGCIGKQACMGPEWEVQSHQIKHSSIPTLLLYVNCLQNPIMALYKGFEEM